MTDEPLTGAPEPEGNDQEAAEGAEAAPVTEEELEDAPATDDDPGVPEESVD